MIKDTCNPSCNTYWDQHVNPRRRAMEVLRRLWIVIAGTAAGALLGVLAYYAFVTITDSELYSGYSEFYLDFALDPTGEVYDYYNGYTWNDLMTTDPIAGHTLDALSDVDLAHLEAVTRADILSDIRVLRVVITDDDQDRCMRIQSATEGALVTFGDEAAEFERITVIKSVAPSRLYADDRTMQAVLLGAVIGFAISVIAVGFMVILDDRICFADELSAFGIPVTQVCPSDTSADRDGADRDDAADRICINARTISPAELSGAGSIPGHGDGPVEVILEIPYGKVHLTLLDRLISMISDSGSSVVELRITETDPRAWKFYYFGSGRSEGTKP